MTSFPISDAALRWLEVLLSERFGHSWRIARVSAGLELHLEGAGGAILFDNLCAGFTDACSNLPCSSWNSEREGWSSVLGGPLPAPGVVEMPLRLVERRPGMQVVHYDIFGLIYWMLARVEEIGRSDLDSHGRFPAISSHSYKHGYLDRPVVDEWLNLLGQVIERQWKRVELKKPRARTLVSCDLDHPFAQDISWAQWISRLGVEFMNTRSLGAIAKTIVGKWHARRGDYRFDAFRYGLDSIMETNEAAGRKVAFYFIPKLTDSRFDGQSGLNKPNLRQLLRETFERGHEVGIHPGYNTHKNSAEMEQSVTAFRRVIEEEGIDQINLGSRQHFLRWETPTTACLLDYNGVDYDSSLGYADHPGFRCGTCFEYPMFDPSHQRPLRLRQRPLVLMETTVLSGRYLGLGRSEAALLFMQKYQKVCREIGGDFTLLWHNSSFEKPLDFLVYRELVRGQNMPP